MLVYLCMIKMFWIHGFTFTRLLFITAVAVSSSSAWWAMRAYWAPCEVRFFLGMVKYVLEYVKDFSFLFFLDVGCHSQCLTTWAHCKCGRILETWQSKESNFSLKDLISTTLGFTIYKPVQYSTYINYYICHELISHIACSYGHIGTTNLCPMYCRLGWLGSDKAVACG